MNVIVAVDKNWAIGYQNKLLVSIPADMRFFRDVTTNKVVIMGKNTLESFPSRQPLKNRVNIVIALEKDYKVKGATVVYSIEEALEEAKKYKLEKIGCHTMRKTFGYHYYQKFKDAVTLMEIFGHADISITLRYIGINQDVINRTMKNFKIF
jgi:dihydrofolate reductase